MRKILALGLLLLGSSPAFAQGTDLVSITSFGAKCDAPLTGGNGTDDAIPIANALASGKRISIPSGKYCYTSKLTQAFMTGPGVFVGPGQIKTSDGSVRGPIVSDLTSMPKMATAYNIVDGFSGNLSLQPITIEHRVGPKGLGDPIPNRYLVANETAGFWMMDHFEAGWNTSTGEASATVGRTGYGSMVLSLDHSGQGDANNLFMSMYVNGPNIPGATSFLANPAGALASGYISAGHDGVYITGIGDVNIDDKGYDVAGIGTVFNFLRTNNTGAIGATWIGHRIQSSGTKAIDAAFSASGLVNTGVDVVGMSGQTAVAMKNNQKIYFNATNSSTTQFPQYIVSGAQSLNYDATKGFNFASNNGNVYLNGNATGLDLSLASFSSAAVKLAASQYMSFGPWSESSDGTNFLMYYNGGSPKIQIDQNGGLTTGSSLVVNGNITTPNAMGVGGGVNTGVTLNVSGTNTIGVDLASGNFAGALRFADGQVIFREATNVINDGFHNGLYSMRSNASLMFSSDQQGNFSTNGFIQSPSRLYLGNNTSSVAGVSLNGANGTVPFVSFSDAGNMRFLMGIDASDAFQLYRYSSSGVYTGNPLSVTANGQTYINEGLAIKNGLDVNLSETHMSVGYYVDPEPGVLRSVKISGSGLSVNGGTNTDTLNVTGNAVMPVGTPASSTATCVRGQVMSDANFVYACSATNTWKRSALSGF